MHLINNKFCSGYAVVRCADSPHAMAAVRSGQGCLTLCGEKRDLWLPNFLTAKTASSVICADGEINDSVHEPNFVQKKSMKHSFSSGSPLLHAGLKVAELACKTSVEGQTFEKRRFRISAIGKLPSKRTFPR